MGLLRILSHWELKKEIKKLKKRLFNNPELRARQLYEFLREQPFETRKYVQTYIVDLPLTKSLKPDYSTESVD